ITEALMGVRVDDINGLTVLKLSTTSNDILSGFYAEINAKLGTS
ncbi:10939_t:CDS:2, partial [Paraglomus occultum]